MVLFAGTKHTVGIDPKPVSAPWFKTTTDLQASNTGFYVMLSISTHISTAYTCYLENVIVSIKKADELLHRDDMGSGCHRNSAAITWDVLAQCYASMHHCVICNYFTPRLIAIRWIRVMRDWKQLILGVSYAECYLQLEIGLTPLTHFWKRHSMS
jgi:trehalose/maltose hydrolase-like predicted phosphorylase